jgi:hypothetical protein
MKSTFTSVEKSQISIGCGYFESITKSWKTRDNLA